MELEVGKKYRIKNRRGELWNWDGRMDHWMGKIVTVSNIYDSVEIEEDDNENGGFKWLFSKDDFEPIEEMTLEKKEKEVVRCEECTMKKSWYETSFGITVCGQSGLFAVNDKSFCSYGEKEKNNAGKID